MDVKSMQGGMGNQAFSASGRGGVGLMDDYQSAAQAQMAALNAGGSSQQHSQPAFVGGAQPPFGAIGSQGGMMMMGAGGGGSGGYMGSNGMSGYERDLQPMQSDYERLPAFHDTGRLMDERGPDQFINDRGSNQFMNERGPRGPDGCGTDGENGVIMLYNIDPERANCDKLFNLFCLYGNVIRVRVEGILQQRFIPDLRA